MKIVIPVLAGMIAISAQTALAQDSTLDKIKESGAIVLGYRESSVPFSYLGSDQQPIGISIDLCEHVVSAIDAALPDVSLETRWMPVNASNRIPLMQNGTIDLECGSTTNTASRQEQVAFSVATFASRVTWLVPKDSGITSENELEGKTVVVTQGSLNAEVLERMNREQALGLQIQRGKEQAESLALLQSGRAAGWFEDDILQAGLAALSPHSDNLTFLASSYPTVSYYGLMMRKDDEAFKTLVDTALVELMQSGTYTELYDKWFTSPIPPHGVSLNLPMSDALKERVSHPSDALSD